MTSIILQKSQLVKLVWAPLAVIIAHSIFASLLDHRQVDPGLHFLGGAAVAYFSWQLFGIAFPSPQTSKQNQFIFAILLSSALFLLWEAGEFTSDRLFETQIQLSTSETLTDLSLSAAGSLLLLLLFWIARLNYNK